MKGFAVTDGREQKALKIEKVINDFLNCIDLCGKDILDIGTGSGHIAEYFSRKNNVWGVDGTNQLKENAIFFKEFVTVTDESLPFADNFFDIIISNHVAAYLPNKKKHFEEIYRVLKPGGICYFATPNRNFPLEPHFKVPVLHYFPCKFFNGIMKLLGKYKEPVHLISYQEASNKAKKYGLIPTDYTVAIIRQPQKFLMDSRPLPFAPKFFKYFSPTMVIVFSKR